MSHSEHQIQPSKNSGKSVVAALTAVFIIYAMLLGMGKPQEWTQKANSGSHAGERGEGRGTRDEGGDSDPSPLTLHPSSLAPHNIEPPPMFMVFPFVALLLCIAILPLVPATAHWWEHNFNRFIIAASLGVLTLLYYLCFHNSAVEGHWLGGHGDPAASGLNFHLAWTVFENAIIAEYIPFIVLLFTLYTIAGGIRIGGDLKAKPLTNTIIIGIGAMLASFIGTTGAAMLLIRLLLDTNRQRKYKVHTVIFFIFVVCNCGGLLTPLGDPPLFLGYLRGVKFEFTLLNLVREWAFVNGLLLALYFLWDTLISYPRESKDDLARDDLEVQPLSIAGWMPNVLLLLGVVFSVLLLDPGKSICGWHPWMFFREMVMLGLVFLSLTLGQKETRIANKFTYSAIVEVAVLFFGIFICMQAPLQILHVHGPNLGLTHPMHFYWASGVLSSFLDNAPTYVVFFETAKTLPLDAQATAEAISICGVAIDVKLLIAVSLGSVFMGAMTYIGNGPNFMVKAIAEESGVKMPSFFGYMVYSCLILLPILFVMTWIFLR